MPDPSGALVPTQRACPVEPASAPEPLVMCPRMPVVPLGSIDKRSTKVSFPANTEGLTSTTVLAYDYRQQYLTGP